MEQSKWINYLALMGLVTFLVAISQTSASHPLQCYSCDTVYEESETEAQTESRMACLNFTDPDLIPLINCTAPEGRGNSSSGFRPKNPENRQVACMKVRTERRVHGFEDTVVVVSRGCGFTDKPTECIGLDETQQCFCQTDKCNGAGVLQGSILGLMVSLVLYVFTNKV
jgi:hypothetical protein